MTDAAPRVRERTRAPASGRQLDVTGGHQEGHIQVTRKRYGSEPETVTRQSIFVPVFETAPAYVGLRAKETINTGDFNSVSVEVSISLPCLPEESELERVHALISDVAERWMDHEIRRATDPNWQAPTAQGTTA